MFDAIYQLFHGSTAVPGPVGPPGPAGSPASAASAASPASAASKASAASAAPAGSPMPADPAPTESDLWIAQALYEFTVSRSVCTSCGAVLGRKVTVTAVPGAPGSAWRIDVDARCRGLRRHRHAAEVTEAQGGLRFGELMPVSA